jgi:UDP-glucose 4-epimerase
MRICIVGGSGYVGLHLAVTLSRQSNAITIFSRNPPVIDHEFTDIPITWMAGDVLINNDIQSIVNADFDAIIYCVSLNHHVSQKNLRQAINVNFLPFEALTDRLVQKKFSGKILYFSTMQVCGALPPGVRVSESYPAFPLNHYGMTHLLCENIVSMYNKLDKLDIASLRLSNSYGYPVDPNADCWWLVVNDLCRSAILNKKIQLQSDGSPQRDFIALDDVTSAVDLLLRSNDKLPNLINIASGQTHTILELAKIISDLTSESGEMIPVSFSSNENEIRAQSLNPSLKFCIDKDLLQSFGFRQQISLVSGIKKMLHDLKVDLIQ